MKALRVTVSMEVEVVFTTQGDVNDVGLGTWDEVNARAINEVRDRLGSSLDRDEVSPTIEVGRTVNTHEYAEDPKHVAAILAKPHLEVTL